MLCQLLSSTKDGGGGRGNIIKTNYHNSRDFYSQPTSTPQALARKEAEERYRDTLRQAGLEEEFVRTKSQGTQAVQGKKKAKAKDSPRY